MWCDGGCIFIQTHVKSLARKVKTSAVCVMSAIYRLLLVEFSDKSSPWEEFSLSSLFSDLKICFARDKSPNLTEEICL